MTHVPASVSDMLCWSQREGIDILWFHLAKQPDKYCSSPQRADQSYLMDTWSSPIILVVCWKSDFSIVPSYLMLLSTIDRVPFLIDEIKQTSVHPHIEIKQLRILTIYYEWSWSFSHRLQLATQHPWYHYYRVTFIRFSQAIQLIAKKIVLVSRSRQFPVKFDWTDLKYSVSKFTKMEPCVFLHTSCCYSWIVPLI